MQQALMEAKSVEQPHRLTLDSRSRLSVWGFGGRELRRNGDPAHLHARAAVDPRAGLRLQQLSIDGGQVLVDGSVDAIVYEDDAPRGSFFARLFG
ncbi:MAG: sporulation protein [Oscillospiraceae bacterium]